MLQASKMYIYKHVSKANWMWNMYLPGDQTAQRDIFFAFLLFCVRSQLVERKRLNQKVPS